MSAEGILSDDVYVDDRTSTISDSLFAIHLQVLESHIHILLMNTHHDKVFTVAPILCLPRARAFS
jgi:hypothetical protein